jgi:hypothetical protein
MEKIGIGVRESVFSFVIIVAVFSYLAGLAKGRQE